MYSYPTGAVTVYAAKGAGPLMLYYSLSGLPMNSMGGFHIHAGMSCATPSSPGGHYWQPANETDPWTTVMWHRYDPISLDNPSCSLSYFLQV